MTKEMCKHVEGFDEAPGSIMRQLSHESEMDDGGMTVYANIVEESGESKMRWDDMES